MSFTAKYRWAASNMLKTNFNIIALSRHNYSKIATIDTESSEVQQTETKINPNYVNRNPRNLEWSGHQFKRFGWNLQYPPKDFYHRCTFKVANGCLEGNVEHSSGKVVIKASTKELPFQRYMYSIRDVNASINLGKLLATRCFKAGITQMEFLKSTNFDGSHREQAFYNAVLENGIVFEEPEFQTRPDNEHGLDYDNPDFYSEKKNVPFPPHVNRIKRKQQLNTEADNQD